MAILGKRNSLSIVRESAPGLYLNGGDLGEILLPKRYIPADLYPGIKLEVFVYRDSEDRLVATTEKPFAEVGDFAALEVVGMHPTAGAFLNWGLAKDLLLPYREQEKSPSVGQRIVVAICLDEKTNRIYASARLRRHLSKETPAYAVGQPVNLLVATRTPLGYSCIVENAHLGLLYHDNLAAPLEPGQRLQGFIRLINEQGKIDLRLDASGYKRVLPLKLKIVQELQANGGKLDFDDASSPAAIRETFGVSKNAFKLALAALYKSRRIRFLKPGIELLDNSNWQPGSESGQSAVAINARPARPAAKPPKPQ